MFREGDYRPIRDYAIIGDGHTAALVASDGSIDWCCWPRFDSPAVFCRLLDAAKGGWFRLGPGSRHSVSRSYEGDTNVLASRFRTGDGEFRLTQFMPAREYGSEIGKAGARVLALAEGISGTSQVEVSFRPAFDYARASTEIYSNGAGAVALAGPERLALSCPARLERKDSGAAEGRFPLKPGERRWITLAYSNDPACRPQPCGDAEAGRLLADTLRYWRKWSGACSYSGPYEQLVRRSALALKLLIYAPAGALIAAPTTSLPEWIGGTRNYDYRYSWLRDSALTLQALEAIGYSGEAMRFFEWLQSLNLHRGGNFQIMFTVDGGTDLPEQTLEHLEGYRKSRPVRIGNAASTHVQLDMFGEVASAVYVFFERFGRPVEADLWSLMREMAGGAASEWRRPDRSIWEMRGEPKNFLYSKLMCWVALDRAIRLAERLALEGPVEHWRGVRDEIRETILSEGYNREAGAFTQVLGSADLDAAALAIPRVGFLPPGDPLVVSTIRSIRERLTSHGLVLRYLSDDGIEGNDAAFALCTFWLVDVLAEQGRVDEAREHFEALVRHASDVGLLSEEIDPAGGELLGNYPQAFTHLGLIRSAVMIAQAEAGRKGKTEGAGAGEARARQ